MNRIFSALIIFLSLVNYNKAYSAAVTPSSYINTVHSVMLCETGSSQTTCLNPVILGSEGTTGKSFDLSSTTAGQSAGGIGSLSSVPYGKTFTWFQVILNRNFTVTAAGSDDTAACVTGGSDASAASGATPADGTRDNTASNAVAQIIRIPDNTAAGIFDAIGPNARRINNSKTPAIIPDNLVFPPALMLTTVRMVAPAPGIPPKTAAILLPMP